MTPAFRCITLTVAGLLAGTTGVRADGKPAGRVPEYNRDIRPIFSENCFACHGPDSAARKADLRLDRREDAIKAGAIVPGDASKSGLVERVFATERSEIMPPPRSHKKLTPAQKEALKAWVAAGAEYQPHWSLIAPKLPPVPAVKDQPWVRTPIDAFIRHRLEAIGLTPAPEADPRTLARRLSLDLTGLPPASADVEAFVGDTSPNAYERYVDRLLATPEWGEHRGRTWLDAARYADTHGIHFDNYREMWSYREWVARAFNQNMPFDRFTIEQLAGDLLPNRTLDQQVASGFNRCNITSNEGGLIPEEYLVLYTRDRVETTAAVWLGLTAGCAVCHDHKFDPLSQREFYEMAAFFNNTTQGAMDGNIPNTPPIVPVPRPEDRARHDELTRHGAEARKAVEARKTAARGEFEAWLKSGPAAQVAAMIPSSGLRLFAGLGDGGKDGVKAVVDGTPRTVEVKPAPAWGEGHVSAAAFKTAAGTTLEFSDAGDFDTAQGFSFGAWVKLPKTTTGAVLARMDDQKEYRGWDLWVQSGQVGAHIVNKWPDDAVKVVSKTALKVNQWHHVFVTYDGTAKAGGVAVYVDGVRQDLNVEQDRLKGTIKTTVPLKVGQRHSTSRIDGLSIQDLRVYGRTLSAEEVERLAGVTRVARLVATAAEKKPGPNAAAEHNELFDWWVRALDKPSHELTQALKKYESEEAAIRSRGTVAHVMQERPQESMAFVLYRGDYDKRRDPVKPSTPKCLPPMPAELPRNRLGFAKWLLQPDHPLTARVTVNRFWQEVFGTGLVRTSGDFGVTGELPSDPELLDWLAVDFREHGWDVKRFFKQIVMSSAYRQSAVTTPEKLAKDAANRYLSRGPRFRMDAEMIRDYALAASGLLVRQVGGPSVKPYQPEGVWEAVAMIGSNTRDYRRDTGANLYRRSMYTFWKRAAPPASMDILNAPNRETCAVRRERTDTPLQALVTLNDPQFVEAARKLAESVMSEAPASDEQRIDRIARRVLCRPLSPEETKVVLASLKELTAFYTATPEDAKKLIGVGESKADPKLDPKTLAALTMLSNEMLNLDEVLNK